MRSCWLTGPCTIGINLIAIYTAIMNNQVKAGHGRQEEVVESNLIKADNIAKDNFPPETVEGKMKSHGTNPDYSHRNSIVLIAGGSRG